MTLKFTDSKKAMHLMKEVLRVQNIMQNEQPVHYSLPVKPSE